MVSVTYAQCNEALQCTRTSILVLTWKQLLIFINYISIAIVMSG